MDILDWSHSHTLASLAHTLLFLFLWDGDILRDCCALWHLGPLSETGRSRVRPCLVAGSGAVRHAVEPEGTAKPADEVRHEAAELLSGFENEWRVS